MSVTLLHGNLVSFPGGPHCMRIQALTESQTQVIFASSHYFAPLVERVCGSSIVDSSRAHTAIVMLCFNVLLYTREIVQYSSSSYNYIALVES